MDLDTYNLKRKAAKQAESESRWDDAAKLWAEIGSEDDEKACLLLADAIREGDEYRARIARELGAEPDKSENPHAWVKWYDGMIAIYNEMFNQKTV